MKYASASNSSFGVRITLRHLARHFGSQQIFTNLSLDIEPGEWIALVGRSGCGKSTLLRLIAGLDSAQSGSIHIGHAHPAASSTQSPDIRLMFQDARLLPWKSVLANVGLGLTGNWQDKAQEALQEVGLAEHAHKWPSQLSGGQRQRVALARALIHKPHLLLLDEPLGALDALTRIEMQQLIERVWQRHRFTVILVTHDVQEAIALADRIVLLEHGRVGLDQTIPFPRPRARGSAEFAALEASILERVLSHAAGTEPVFPHPPSSIVPSTLRWAL